MGAYGTSNLPVASAITLFGVPVWDLDRSHEEYNLVGKSTAERKILVGLNDFATLVNAALVPLPAVPASNNAWPADYAYPAAPWMRILRVVLGKLVPIPFKGLVDVTYTNPVYGNLGHLVGGNYIEATLVYGQLNYTTFNTGALRYDFSSETVPLQQEATLYYNGGSGALPAGSNLSLEVPIINLSYTRKQQPSIPQAYIAACISQPVNSANFPMTTAGTNVGVYLLPGYVKYVGTRTSESNQGGGGLVWEVEHNFQWRSVGWNVVQVGQPSSVTTMSDLFKPAFWDPALTIPAPYPTSDITILLN